MSTRSPYDLFSVQGKRAVVTGGSRGIGLMAARGLVAAGAEVIISSRKAEAVEKAAAELSASGTCIGIPADLSTHAGAHGLAEAVRGHWDSVDILVNNAGANWGAPIEEFPDAGWDRVLDTNVKGVFHLTVALLPQLRAAATPSAPARVVNVGSIDGLHVPAMETYSYTASKAAVHQLTRHLAKRLASEAITVNAIAPGPFDSRMMAFLLDDPALRANVAAEVPLGRIGEPDDIVGVLLFLTSRAGAYLTGTVIPVDGGMTGVL